MADRTPPERIYRYLLDIIDEPTIRMPRAARVLSVAAERRHPWDGEHHFELWALVDPTVLEHEERAFRVVSTGNPMPGDCGRFLGTVPTHGGMFVWHVFEAQPAAVAACTCCPGSTWCVNEPFAGGA